MSAHNSILTVTTRPDGWLPRFSFTTDIGFLPLHGHLASMTIHERYAETKFIKFQCCTVLHRSDKHHNYTNDKPYNYRGCHVHNSNRLWPCTTRLSVLSFYNHVVTCKQVLSIRYCPFCFTLSSVSSCRLVRMRWWRRVTRLAELDDRKRCLWPELDIDVGDRRQNLVSVVLRIVLGVLSWP